MFEIETYAFYLCPEDECSLLTLNEELNVADAHKTLCVISPLLIQQVFQVTVQQIIHLHTQVATQAQAHLALV